MTTNTSPDGGAMPTQGTPATGNASVSATPPKTPTTLEEALAELAELRRHATNKEEQATRHGKDLTAAQKRLAEYEEKERLAREAQLSETQKAQETAQAYQQKYEAEHKQHINAFVKLAAVGKGIIDPDIAALAVAASLEFDEAGRPSNLDKALDDLLKDKPYLATKPAEPATTSVQTAQHPPAVPAMNPERNQGRSAITPAQSQGPFKPTTFADVYKRP